ncbi:rhodanese-like domain-containing protein [Atopococcus tabaci]|uniref:rhodanese-like domain-containing protein n=1 Tax=Atopococcus tabaci TaxID=269774 RepID=UPI000410F658|nr:rhodanese-like domain-containing protein [Atopococcus tabaci]
MDTTTVLNIIIWGALAAWGIYEIIQYFRRKNAAQDLTSEEFKQNMRKVQVIDVREKDEFAAGHILGARNIPYIQMKQRLGEIRRDQPVYLYDERRTLSRRASLLLKKEGFTDIYRLKDGYESWDGKIKRDK